jgi:hypothetical protein
MGPAGEMTAIAQKFNFIAVHAPSATVRYKASLAAIVFDHPGLFAREREAEYIDADHLFTALARTAIGKRNQRNRKSAIRTRECIMSTKIMTFEVRRSVSGDMR